MRISDWSSDVCSSDLLRVGVAKARIVGGHDQIARQSDFQSAGITMSVHRRDDRLGQDLQHAQRLAVPTRRRRLLALRDVGAIMACGKALSRPAHYHAGYARIILECLDVAPPEIRRATRRERGCQDVESQRVTLSLNKQ